jgi:hypothetical protein
VYVYRHLQVLLQFFAVGVHFVSCVVLCVPFGVCRLVCRVSFVICHVLCVAWCVSSVVCSLAFMPGKGGAVTGNLLQKWSDYKYLYSLS